MGILGLVDFGIWKVTNLFFLIFTSLDDEANSPILIPDDLILIDATEFSGSPGKKYVLGFRIGYDWSLPKSN